MATQAKDQHGPGKEKRGTSPSYPRQTDTTTNSRRSPSAPSPSRPPDKKHAPTTSEKRIPNYLKPTVSSAPKTQTSSNHTAQKPSLNRRRSFDKPPSPDSRLQKSHTMIIPKDKIVVRSSSKIVPKASSSVSKPHQDRFLKAHRDAGKSHALSSHAISSVHKKTTSVKKQNVDATTSAVTVPTKASVSSSPDLTEDTAPLVECHKEDQESFVADVEEERELVQAEESKSELPTHVSVLEEDQKEDIKADTGGSSRVREAETVKDQNQEIKMFEPSIVSQNQNDSLDVHMEGAEDGEQIVEETRKDESLESHQEERVDGDDKEGEESATENSKGKSMDKEEEVGEGSQMECKEIEKVEDNVTETKTEMENTAGKQQQQQQGKKETQAYNDVIEETASKLREERKNKVKALVGAFETVISLQEPEA